MFTKFDIITIGGSTEDVNFHVDDYLLLDNKKNAAGNKLLAFDYGTKINVSKSFTSFGGGAANTAVTFASLGLKTACLTACGNDERGQRIVANLKSRGVNTKLIKKINRETSSFSFIVIGDNNEHVAFSNRAANANLTITPTDVKKLKKTKWLYVTSFSGSWKTDFDRIFDLANKIKIAWNPGIVQLSAGYKVIKKYLLKTEILIVNKDEAVKLVSSHPKYAHQNIDFLSKSKNLLTIISSWGPRIVIITNGTKGADAFDGQKYYKQATTKSKKRADTTGLGDAFGSAFVASFKILHGNVKKSLHIAACNSASVLSKPGAQNGVLTKSEFDKFAKQ